MGLFKPAPAIDADRTAKLLKATEETVTELAELRAEIKALREERDATVERDRLKREVTDLKIEKDRLVETNKRDQRETEHKVGLLIERQAEDLAAAKRETELAVREENLAADKARFGDQVKFEREHTQREIDRVEAILGEVLKRLPDVSAALRINGGQTDPEE
jgi:hypothetical protein